MMIINKQRNMKFKTIGIIFVLCTLFITGCTSSTSTIDDIETMKKSEDGRTKITLLTKYAFSTANFEQRVEEKFPDIDIVLVGDYTANTALAKEYEARLKHDDLTDIVMTWPMEAGMQYCKDRLIDMAGMNFTNRYNVSMLDSIADNEGNLYYLPGPASIRGIIYNKTLFEENGWQVPNNYDEFAALCKKIEESGIAAFQIPLGNEEVLDTAFIGFNYGTSYSKPKDTEWISKFNEGEGNFLDHFDKAVDNFQALIDDGIIKASDLDLTYADTQSNLYTRKSAMSEDSVMLINLAATIGGSKDEYAMMPFFNRDPNNSWARLYMVCYIGLNKHLQDEGNEEKYEKVLAIMDYISSEEGQLALSTGNGSMFSSLQNFDAPNDKEIKDMKSTLDQGRYGVFIPLKRSEAALRKGLQGMLEKTITKQELAQMVDEQNQMPSIEVEENILGEASENFTFIDTGSFVSDVIRKYSKSDIALYLDNGKDGLYNGKGISAKFYKGEISETDINRILPDFKYGESGELWNITMTGENLLKTLEYSISVNANRGWFYYFSGLKVEFNPTAEMGSRIISIKSEDGKEIDKNAIYSIAVGDHSVPEEYMLTCDKTGVFINDLLRNEIKENKIITPAKDNRFKIME